MTNLHGIGCLCAGCQETREHWQAMGMAPAVVRQQVREAGRPRTEILSDQDLRATWAPTMAAIAAKEARRQQRGKL